MHRIPRQFTGLIRNVSRHESSAINSSYRRSYDVSRILSQRELSNKAGQQNKGEDATSAKTPEKTWRTFMEKNHGFVKEPESSLSSSLSTSQATNHAFRTHTRTKEYVDNFAQKDNPVAPEIRFKRLKSDSDAQFQEKKRVYYMPFAEARGISIQKYLELLDQHSRSFLPEDKKVCMRINAYVLKDIIKRRDSFKSLHVTNMSSGLLDRQARRIAEKERLGNYSQDLADEVRPIHGYIATSTQPLGLYDPFFKFYFVDKYGDVAAVFEDELMRRTSFTVGDSLDNSDVRAVPLEHPNGDCFPLGLPIISREDLKKPDSLLSKIIKSRDPLNKRFEDCIPYLDSQYHYGVSLQHVEKFIITGQAAKDEELIELVQKQNIPFDIILPKTSS